MERLISGDISEDHNQQGVTQSASQSSQSRKRSDFSAESFEESKKESNKPALNQAIMIPNFSSTGDNNSFLRRGRTLGTKDTAQEDVLDRLKLIDTAMERAMRNQEPMVFPDEVEAIEDIQRQVPESIMEHGHAETSEQEGNLGQLSPSMPNHNIVEDDADYELNKDRETLANIRIERAESWQIDS